MANRKIAVLDIGGSFIKYGQMNEELHILNRGKMKTYRDDIDEFYRTLDHIWEEIGAGMQGLAVSMPGVIDSVRGYAISGGSLTILDQSDFAGELRKRYHVPVWIGNDAKCAAVAEVGYGVLKDVDSAVAIILGTGVGGCLIRDGKVYFGKHFSAGEVSFLHINYRRIHDRDEWWANVNGIEGFLSIVQEAMGTEEVFSGEEIFAMARDGNQAVLRAIDRFAEIIAVQIFNIHCICDVEKAAIGGGISQQTLLIEKINEKFTEIFSEYPFPLFRPPIVACRFCNDANLIGAYYQFCQMQEEK